MSWWSLLLPTGGFLDDPANSNSLGDSGFPGGSLKVGSGEGRGGAGLRKVVSFCC